MVPFGGWLAYWGVQLLTWINVQLFGHPTRRLGRKAGFYGYPGIPGLIGAVLTDRTLLV